jgi:hypothetical protein
VADNTARQDGSLVTISERLSERLQRHGPDWPGGRANPERDDYIRGAARRVAQWLASMGRTDAYLDVCEETSADGGAMAGDISHAATHRYREATAKRCHSPGTPLS